MNLRSKQVVWYLKLNTHAGAIPTVSLPQDLAIRSGAEAGQADLCATLLNHAGDCRLGDDL
jgi:hypothetical protein